MVKFGKKVVKYRIPILIASILLLVPAVFGYANTKVNYDVLTYLPEDIEKLVGVAVIGQIPEIEGTEKNYKYWELANGGTISYETNDYASKHEEQK